MPNRAELEQALRNADAAGDVEAAQMLAQELGRMSGQTVPESPTPTRLGPRVSGRMPTPEDLAAADRGGKELGQGIIEGGRRLMGGGKQFLGGLADFFKTFVHGTPYRGPDVRLPDGQIIRGGDLETSRYNKATANEILRQVNQKQEAIEQGLDPNAVSNVATGVEIGTLAVAPEVVGPRATTLMSAAGRNIVTTGATSGVQFDPDSMRRNDVLIGTLLGPVLGTVPAALPAAKNAVGRALTDAANNPRVKSAFNAARKTLKRTDFSLAQIAQIPQLIALERAAYSSPSVEFYAKQSDNLIADFVEAMGQNIPAGTKLGNEFIRTRQGMAGALKAAHTNASKGYEAGMSEASRLANRVQAPQGPAPGKRDPETFNQGVPARPDNVVDIRTRMNRGPTPTGARVPVSNFTSQAKATFAQAREPQAAGGRPIGFAWMKQMEQQLSKGYLTVQETEAALRQLSALQNKDGPARALGYKLRSALESDLDLLEQNAGAATDDAIRTVIETRKEYKRSMQMIDAMQDSAAYKLMGIKSDGELDLHSSQLLDRFKQIGPERQIEVRNFLRETNLDMLHALRNEAINDAVRVAQAPLAPAADSRASFEALDNALFDSDKGVFRTAGLWDKTEGEKLNDVRDALRLVVAERPQLKGPGTQVKAEDVAINLVSRHSGFVARQLTRYLMSAKASEFFTDPQVRTMLMKINRTTTGTPANLTMRAALLSYLQDNCDETCYEQSSGVE